MKKLLFLFFALCCMYNAKAQTLPYKSMEQFGTDSIAYMQYNFIDRKAQYINQPVSKILDDYELEMAVFEPKITHPYFTSETVVIIGAFIQYTENYDRELPYGRLYIYFKTPHLPWESTRISMYDDEDEWEWVEKLKNCIVEDISLAVGPFGKH